MIELSVSGRRRHESWNAKPLNLARGCFSGKECGAHHVHFGVHEFSPAAITLSESCQH